MYRQREQTCFIVMLTIGLMFTCGCQSQQTRDQIAAIEAKVLSQQEMIGEHERSLASFVALLKAERAYHKGRGQYSLFRGRAQGVEQDIIYVTENSTKRMVAMRFNGKNLIMEVIAGRAIGNDFAGKKAQAGFVDAKDVGVKLTSYVVIQVASDFDAIASIDDKAHRLLIYQLDYARKRIDLVATESLAKLLGIRHPDVDDPLGERGRGER